MLMLNDFYYLLPPERIAQRPLEGRDASRMLVLNRESGELTDDHFANLPKLLQGDELVVMNNARVIPARLFARRLASRAKESSDQGNLLPAIEIDAH